MVKLHEFTMHDEFNTPIETLNQYARDAVDRNDFMFWGDDVYDVVIDRIEQEGLPVQKDEKTICYLYVVYGRIVTKTDHMIDNIEKDSKTLLEYYDKPLANILLGEDIPELIKLARRVSDVFARELPEGTGDQYQGYCDAICALRKEIYG